MRESRLIIILVVIAYRWIGGIKLDIQVDHWARGKGG
jgi:hypothetical protein